MGQQVTIDQAIALAMNHHQSGRLPEAENIYRQILSAAPNHPTALHFLGVIAHQVGRNDLAEPLIRRSIAQTPENASFHNNLGQVLRALGKPAEAVDAFRRSAALGPTDLDCRLNLSIAFREVGQIEESVATARAAIALAPNRAEPHLQLAASLMARGDLAEAERAVRDALARRADSGEGLELLGAILAASGRAADAEPVLRRAAAILPGSSTVWNNLGIALARQRRAPEAAEAFGRAVATNAKDMDARLNLGAALQTLGRAGEAVEHFRVVAEARPTSVEVLLGLGAALAGAHRLEEAVATWRRALELAPENATAHNNIAAALTTMGAAHEAIPYYRRAIEIDPSMQAIHSNMLLDLHYVEGIPPEQMLAEHTQFARRHANLAKQPIDGRPNDASRKLKVGYFSPDFRAHSVADFIAPVLAGHDRSRFEVHCYANVQVPDAFTRRLRGHADQWRDVTPLTDEQAAELIRSDGIDILVDLAGHTANGRPLIFTRRPAAVQVTYLGYPDTTGLAEMDYRVTDPHADPPGETDHLHTERLLRLPRTAWCYLPYPESPDVSPLPADGQGCVTFGSFNNLAKVMPGTIALWAEVLHAVPGSRLLLKASGLGSESARRRVWDAFASHGVDQTRVELVGRIADFISHLAAYGRVDVGLDTYPYHGTTTTCEAMYMGVPVVTLAGRTHVSRVGVSLLTNMGLTDLVAQSREQYVRLAAALAADRSRLRELRATLRGRMERSPLMDAGAFVRDLENAYLIACDK